LNVERASALRFPAPLAVVAALLIVGPLPGLAQTSPPPGATASPAPARTVPAPADLEPAVDTTRSAPAATMAPPAAAPANTGPAATTPAADAAARTQAAATGTPTVRKGAAAGAKPGAPKGPDRLQLDTTDITGNRELPKVLYIVPWKRSDLGDLVGKPVNSLVDEVLQPLDRDVFQRQNRYYDALKPTEAAAKTGAVQGSGDKP
jgi:hypothetical protein